AAVRVGGPLPGAPRTAIGRGRGRLAHAYQRVVTPLPGGAAVASWRVGRGMQRAQQDLGTLTIGEPVDRIHPVEQRRDVQVPAVVLRLGGGGATITVDRIGHGADQAAEL